MWCGQLLPAPATLNCLPWWTVLQAMSQNQLLLSWAPVKVGYHSNRKKLRQLPSPEWALPGKTEEASKIDSPAWCSVGTWCMLGPWSEATLDALVKEWPRTWACMRACVSALMKPVILQTCIPALLYKGELLDFELVNHNHCSNNPWDIYVSTQTKKKKILKRSTTFQELNRLVIS